MSTHYPASNQLRLWPAAFAFLLQERLRTLGLAGSELASYGRQRAAYLLKAAAQVRVRVRRVQVQLSNVYPLPARFKLCHRSSGRWFLPEVDAAHPQSRSAFPAVGVSKRRTPAIFIAE